MEFDFKSDVIGRTVKCHIDFQRYHNGRIALVIYKADTLEPYGKATINEPSFPLKPDQVFIKDYAENKGILQSLIDAKIVIKNESWIASKELVLCYLHPDIVEKIQTGEIIVY